MYVYVCIVDLYIHVFCHTAIIVCGWITHQIELWALHTLNRHFFSRHISNSFLLYSKRVQAFAAHICLLCVSVSCAFFPLFSCNAHKCNKIKSIKLYFWLADDRHFCFVQILFQHSLCYSWRISSCIRFFGWLFRSFFRCVLLFSFHFSPYSLLLFALFMLLLLLLVFFCVIVFTCVVFRNLCITTI